MPIVFPPTLTGHPTTWAKNLVKLPVGYFPAANVGTNAKRLSRDNLAGLVSRRVAEPRPQPLRDARLRSNFRASEFFHSIAGVDVVLVHDQIFQFVTDPQSFSTTIALGPESSRRQILIAIVCQFDPSSSDQITNVLVDGIAHGFVTSGDQIFFIQVDQPLGATALLTFDADTTTTTGAGVLRVLVFNVKGAEAQSVFSTTDNFTPVNTIPTEGGLKYGAMIAVNTGPGYETGVASIDWTGSVQNPTRLIEHHDFNFDDGLTYSIGAAWSPLQQGGDFDVIATDAGTGSGSSFQTLGVGVVIFNAPFVAAGEGVFTYEGKNTITPGIQYVRRIDVQGLDVYDGNDEVFNEVDVGNAEPGKLIVIGIAGLFFAHSGVTLLGGTIGGQALTLLDYFDDGGFIYGAWLYAIAPSIPNPAELRLTWSGPLGGFSDQPFSGITLWTATGYDPLQPILDFAHLIDSTSDGSESVQVDVNRNGVIFGITEGAFYTTVNTQTWTGLDSVYGTPGFGVFGIGERQFTVAELNHVVLSTDDAGIPPDTSPEKFVMAISLKASSNLDGDVGVFTLYGQDATLSKGFFFDAGVGSFTLTGQDTSPIHTYFIDVEAGLFTYTLVDVINPPGLWIEDPGVTDGWVEGAPLSDSWTEELPLVATWTEQT